jgi:hypothetical protein
MTCLESARVRLKEGSSPSRVMWVGTALSADWMRPFALTPSVERPAARRNRNPGRAGADDAARTRRRTLGNPSRTHFVYILSGLSMTTVGAGREFREGCRVFEDS